MAKTEPVKLVTQTPVGNYVEITLKRWFQTREFWVNLAAWVATVAPIGATGILQLGLTPSQLLVWSVVIQSANWGANQYLKNTSKSVVVPKDVLANEAQAQGAINDGQAQP